jgi:formate dehydrogenase subunit gamma
VLRFTRTERAVHWVHAAAFLVMLATGLVLYLPDLAALVGRRPLLRTIHVDTALAWACALAAIAIVGNRRALWRTARDVERFDGDDLRWLRGDRRAPQGRFNAGQKLNAILTAAFALLFAVTGLLIWLAEHDLRFRLEGTILVHDALTYVSVVLLAGHLYLAVIHPRTRHALRGMVTGSVRADWAAEHHPKWTAPPGAAVSPPRPGSRAPDSRSPRR